MTPEEAKEAVGDFLAGAKAQCLDEFERALRKIARMPWWKRLWLASDVANEALGTGKYWNKGFKK